MISHQAYYGFCNIWNCTVLDFGLKVSVIESYMLVKIVLLLKAFSEIYCLKYPQVTSYRQVMN